MRTRILNRPTQLSRLILHKEHSRDVTFRHSVRSLSSSYVTRSTPRAMHLKQLNKRSRVASLVSHSYYYYRKCSTNFEHVSSWNARRDRNSSSYSSVRIHLPAARVRHRLVWCLLSLVSARTSTELDETRAILCCLCRRCRLLSRLVNEVTLKLDEAGRAGEARTTTMM